MQQPPPAADEQRTHRAKAHLAWLWLPVVFVVGILAGGLIVAVFDDGNTVAAVTPRPTVTITRPAAAPSQARAVISQACLRAVEDARTATGLLTQAVAAIRDLDPGALGKILRQAQDLQRRLSADLDDCHVTVRPPSDATTPTPSGSP